MTAEEQAAVVTVKQRDNMFTSTVVPFFLITVIPQSVIILWYTAVHCDGSFSNLLYQFYYNNGLTDMYGRLNIASSFSIKIILGFIIFQVILMKILPGSPATGPETSKGNLPEYKDNGFKCYVATMLSFFALTWYLKQIGKTPTVVYDNFGDILLTMIIFSLIFCFLLYLKGLYYPSSTDNGSSSNFIFDYYWGTELYPRIFGIDVKVFTNCRFGLTAWALLVCVFALKSYELHGVVDGMVVSTILQILYLTKFFWWEAGYYRTIDIIVDRAGFYICWGCLCFVPGFYTLVSLFLVKKNIQLGLLWSVGILTFGLLSLWINYWADAQRQYVRQLDGQTKVWGKQAKIIRAKYRLENGENRQAVLLASGFWGLSRHFHYIPELTLTWSWSAVTADGPYLMPYLYLIFLTILLLHRSFRDDKKCRQKYGSYWNEYCKLVPYKIIPFVF